jgi:hypothetical protein
MRWPALLLLLPSLAWANLAAPAHPADPAFARRSEQRITAALGKAQGAAAGWPRTRAVSEAMLGIPYEHSALGEGAGVDPGPRLRFDRVDCVTFVETALAFGNARSGAEAGRLLDDIRYASGSAPAFAHRLHVMEAQWIPDQIRKGYLEDVTRAVGGVAVVDVTSTYTPESWAKRSGLPELAWADAPHGSFSLPVLPLADALRLAPELPEGLVLSVVREPQPGSVSLVSHTGFVVIKDGKRYLRHAMLSLGQVTDEPLENFLRRHAAMRKRRVVGVHLLAVRDNSARVRKLELPSVTTAPR